MDYQLDVSETQFVKDVASFFEEQIAPRAAGLDGCPRTELAGRMKENLRILAKENLFAEGFSNDSLDMVRIYLSGEELSRACASTFLSARSSSFMCGGALTLFGTTRQKKAFLPGLMNADTIGAIAYSEDAAGTDIAAIGMQARKENDGWVINGKKHVVVNAPIADIFLVLAYTAPDADPEQGMGFFLIERDSPGLVVGETLETMGMRGVPLASLELKDCACREILGEVPGRGFEQFEALMRRGCVGITSMCVGIGTACMEVSTRHAKQRMAFGRQIGKFQDIGFKLADMFSFNDLGRMLGLRAAWALNANEPDADELAACSKLFASQAVNKIADWGMQVFAGHGYIKGSEIERLYRDARFAEICEGTSEMQRELISRRELDRFSRI